MDKMLHLEGRALPRVDHKAVCAGARVGLRMEHPCTGKLPWYLCGHARLEILTEGSQDRLPTFELFLLNSDGEKVSDLPPDAARSYVDTLNFPPFMRKSERMVQRPAMRTSWLRDQAFLFFLITERESIVNKTDNDMDVVIQAWISMNQRKQRFLLSLYPGLPIHPS